MAVLKQHQLLLFFIEMCFIIPAVNSIVCSAYYFRLMVNKVFFCIMDIEVINYKFAAGFQTSGNGTDRIIMFPPGFEITKAGKKLNA